MSRYLGRRVSYYCLKKSSTFEKYLTKNRRLFGAKVMALEQMEFGDVVFVERPNDVRIMARFSGNFSLANRWDRYGDRRVFSCRAVNLSSYLVALYSPVSTKVGERVVAQIDSIGKLDGVVVRVLEHGFVMNFKASDESRDNFATKLEWLEKHKNHDIRDRRAAARVIPTDLYSCMILSDGSRETCQVLNISVFGAAVSGATLPEIGTVVTIGKVEGRVVRDFKGGFAVQFVER